MSQADILYEGRLVIEQPWANDVPWPAGQWTFAPLGYRPAAGGKQRTAIVPTYSTGLPLLMALARHVGGPCAMFWVVPIAGGILVLSTFGLGRAAGSPGAGLLAAALVLVSPVFLFMIMSPMTDVPVAAAWALALWLLVGSARARTPGSRVARVLAAGLAAALAVLIRPNLAGCVLALGLWFPLQWRRDVAAWRRIGLEAAVFAAAAGVGVVAVAMINQHLYGSPLMSGYGGATRLFSTANIWPNVQTYGAWFIESHTVWPLAGLVAIALPIAVFWPGARDRSPVIVIAVTATAALGSYLVYDTFDAWWYLRFLLPVWPMLMLGFAALALALARRGRTAAVVVGVFLVWLAVRDVMFARDHNAFRLWKEERRYASVGRLVRAATEPSSVIFAIQHSGSLRRYAGRLTLRFDSLDDAWLDRAIAWLSEHGIASYLLIEDWEAGRFRDKFKTQAAVARIDDPPIIDYTGPATVRLYDLAKPRDPLAAVTEIREMWEGPRCQAIVAAPAGLGRRD